MIHRGSEGHKSYESEERISVGGCGAMVWLRMVLRNCWMLILAALIAGMGAKLALDWLWTPEYTSTITYAVLSKSASATLQTITMPPMKWQ